MPDPCGSYRELQRHAREGRDYCIECRPGTSGGVVMAPHGGGIEPGTDIIARAVAGEEHGYYLFIGLLPRGNARLHLTSNRFDEPRALSLARTARTVLTIHGCRGDEPVVWIGGLDDCLKRGLMGNLRRSGFDARTSDRPGLRGKSSDNLCNRGRRSAGAQIEISQALRRNLLAGLPARGTGRPGQRFQQFVRCLRAALSTAVDRPPQAPPGL